MPAAALSDEFQHGDDRGATAGLVTAGRDGSTAPANLTDSDIRLQYRDDYQMMSTNVYLGTAGGLTLAPGTYHAFGNNGSVAYHASVNSTANTALNNRLVTNGPVFISAAQLLVDLTGASDHLPIVADYTIPIPAPAINSAGIAGTNLVLNVANSITGAVYTVLMATNPALAFSNWMPVATNMPASGGFSWTVTNAFSSSAPAQFYILRTQ